MGIAIVNSKDRDTNITIYHSNGSIAQPYLNYA